MLILGGTVLTFDPKTPILIGGAILVRGDQIADLGPASELIKRHPGEKIMDARDKLLMPGLICAHTHFYGAFARGMAIPGEPPRNFPHILEKLWWRLDKTLSYEDIRYSTLVCLVDAIKHGTTTLIDHHASQGAIDGSLDIIAEAVEQAGLRACLCYEVTDRDGQERMEAGVRENERFIRKSREKGSLIRATFGLHASLTLSDETLEKCAASAYSLESGFHLHVAEDKADQEDSLRRSGLRVVERLHRFGILGSKTIAAHCVHVNEREIEILKETGTRVVHNPRSNMNNAVGTAPVIEMLARGIEVGLGNDGFSNNMFVEMHTAYLVHRLAKLDPQAIGADLILKMAFTHNTRTASLFWPERPLGTLEPGAWADIIIINYHPTTPITESNYPWHIIFGVDGTGVDTVIVGGKILMEKGKLLTLDEEEITARSQELALKLWRRL
ncbi:MAG: putative aminohydrolase SsnA [Anaerolineae bacterium]|nr:putative aminohydrolase SsnA [Anaerolineae bacterium]MDW8102065.1 putative aminohydrolase SsnA [Anaerolineae bacterium]